MFGRECTMGETKGQDLSSATQRRALFTLGEGLEAAFSGSTTLLRAPYGVTNFYNRRATWTRKIVRSVKPGVGPRNQALFRIRLETRVFRFPCHASAIINLCDEAPQSSPWPPHFIHLRNFEAIRIRAAIFCPESSS